ncbi:hypothetical protein NDU88_002547 [Pleurodeles waltl]|uniref:Gypsy retrotransposon integrase-like protein 1 n=1 Tax=Pleurodeles waltl TaxID=8319 RepID=A0AAV7NDY0_PLEWA|nr:hypothetical protein NDU88_002547 [Pleurodeles waltl]
MIDSGATGNFIDAGVVRRLGLPSIPRKDPEIVLAVDGTPLKSGSLTEHTEDVGLIFNGVSPEHKERIRLDIIEAPQYEIILGMPWLRKHNPVIDWQTKTVSFQSSRCENICFLYDESPMLALAQGLQLATVMEKTVILPSVYAEFKDVFDEGQAETLPPHRIYDCKIDLIPGALLPSCRVYALSDPETKHLRKYLDHFLEIGFIRPSCSPAASPLFFIAKANKELRTCIDYRMLNKNTVRNRYPLPLIPVLLEQVKEAVIYTRLDLKGAYHLVRIREGDEWKTAFKTRYGLFEYLVMPFGLCNAPAAFQYFLNDVLKEYVDCFVFVYIDDILVYSTSLERHLDHVSLVLLALRQHSLFCKLSKCEFHVRKVEFLGVDLSPEGFCMSTRKIQAVQEWPVPTSVRDVQCFLGFSNYYRRFIFHFSHIVSPITRLLRKGVSFVWSEEAEEAFCFLKQAFCSAPILQHPQPDAPFIVEADASDIAIGAVLSQRNKTTGQLHPVAFLSRKLSAAELNYTVAEKELLAIKKAFQEWRHYLWGAQHPVTVYTDHRNLQYMKEARQLTQRQMRWMLFFSEYEFVVTFRPGVDNRKADSLSRQEDVRTIASRPEEAIIKPERVLCALHISHFLEKVSKHKSAAQWKKWAELSQDRTLKHGIPLQGNRLYLPTRELRVQAFNWCHDAVTAGHPGYTKTAQIVQRHFRWEGWAKDVAAWVARCEICARAKGENAKSQGRLIPLPTPDKPWQTISVDFVVGLPMDQGYNAIMVVIDSLTKMGHFLPCRNLPTASQTAHLILSQVVRLHGLPRTIISDRGPQFVARFWRMWCKVLRIESALSTSFHPQTDGQTERLNQTLKKYLRCYAKDAQESWASLLWLAELSYNNAWHSSIRESPFRANTGFHAEMLPINIPREVMDQPTVHAMIKNLQSVQKKIRLNLEKAKEQYKKWGDEHRREGPAYQPGDRVWLSTKYIRFKMRSVFHPRYIGPYEVLRQINPVAYRLNLPASLRIHPVFHCSLLKPALSATRQAVPPVVRDGQLEYEVRRVLDSKRRGGKLWYLVSWKGYNAEDDSWEPESNIHAPRAVRLFHARHPSKPGPRRRFGGGRTVRC